MSHAEAPTILHEIGRGAYGTVYLARQGTEFAALKEVVRPSNGDDAAFARELRGIQTLLRLPPVEGLVRIRWCEIAPDGNSFRYAMDLADDELGGPPDSGHYRPRTLASVASAEVALPLRECVDIAVRLAGALERLQRLHIVHRDIKPGNVLYVRGKAVLADIGLLADERETASIVGTPGYAPPERQGSPAGDVYGLGKTLYRISTGRPPEEQGLAPCAEADIDNPCFWRWMVILSKATAKLPSQRYRSAKAMLRDLRDLRRHLLGGRARRLRWLLLVPALAVLLPAAWNLSVFRAWMTMDPSARYHLTPSFPYNLLKPLFAPRQDPCAQDRDSIWHLSEHLRD